MVTVNTRPPSHGVGPRPGALLLSDNADVITDPLLLLGEELAPGTLHEVRLAEVLTEAAGRSGGGSDPHVHSLEPGLARPVALSPDRRPVPLLALLPHVRREALPAGPRLTVPHLLPVSPLPLLRLSPLLGPPLGLLLLLEAGVDPRVAGVGGVGGAGGRGVVEAGPGDGGRDDGAQTSEGSSRPGGGVAGVGGGCCGAWTGEILT